MFPTVRKIAKSPVVIKGALLLLLTIMIIFEGKTRQLIRFYRVYQSRTQRKKLENNPSEEFQVGPISSLAIHKKKQSFYYQNNSCARHKSSDLNNTGPFNYWLPSIQKRLSALHNEKSMTLPFNVRLICN